MLDGLRRYVNQEIRDRIVDRQVDAETVEWWTLMKNGLTLTYTYAGANLCFRLLEMVRQKARWGQVGKRRRPIQRQQAENLK